MYLKYLKCEAYLTENENELIESFREVLHLPNLDDVDLKSGMIRSASSTTVSNTVRQHSPRKHSVGSNTNLPVAVLVSQSISNGHIILH